GRISFAFGRVVIKRPCSRNDVTKLRSKARRCDVFLLSLRPELRCLILHALFGRALCDGPAVLIEFHTERKSHLSENFLNLVERLSAEILRLQHFGFALCDKLPNRPYVCVL